MPGDVPELTISGNADQRGAMHGHGLTTEIENCIEFYGRLFGRRQQEIFTAANHFRKVIANFNREYCDEIEALAAAAQVNPAWIYALNARSEILNTLALECTALFFRRSALLGQNWDWSAELEPLIRLVTIQPESGPVTKMMTEPGIIGKIGMNSEGLGVCLNILSCLKPTKGVPVHILLRAILDSPSLDRAREMTKLAGPGRASNIMIGSAGGDCLDIEFAAERQFELPGSEVLLHTNHYIGGAVAEGNLSMDSSHARYERAREMVEGAEDINLEVMERILLDRSGEDLAVCSYYHKHETLGDMGTVCTIIMDLKKREMCLKKGNGAENSFSLYSF